MSVRGEAIVGDVGGGVCPEAAALTNFGCYTSQTHIFIAEMLLSVRDRDRLCVSVRARGKTILSY